MSLSIQVQNPTPGRGEFYIVLPSAVKSDQLESEVRNDRRGQ